MVVVSAVRLAIIDIKCLIGEWFLQTVVISDDQGCGCKLAYVATVAAETIAMIFAFQLAVGGGYRLLLYRKIAAAALIGGID